MFRNAPAARHVFIEDKFGNQSYIDLSAIVGLTIGIGGTVWLSGGHSISLGVNTAKQVMEALKLYRRDYA